jgi:hypothetical protein
VRKPVVVKSATSSTTASGTTANLSSSGALLSLDISFAVGTSVELVFDMPTLAGDSYYQCAAWVASCALSRVVTDTQLQSLSSGSILWGKRRRNPDEEFPDTRRTSSLTRYAAKTRARTNGKIVGSEAAC